MVLLKYFKRKALRKFSRKNFIGSNSRKFSLANVSTFTVSSIIMHIIMIYIVIFM